MYYVYDLVDMYITVNTVSRSSKKCMTTDISMSQSDKLIDKMGFTHFTQCWVSVINGSNHWIWIIPQPEQVNKIDPWLGGHEVLFAMAQSRFDCQPLPVSAEN